MTRGKVISALVAVAMLGSLPARAETLREALAAAYLSNPDLLAARAQQRSVDEQVPQAISNWMPTGTYTNQKFNSKSLSQTVRGSDQELINDNEFAGSNDSRSFRGDIDFFRGFRNVYEYNSAQAQVKAGRANLADTEQQVLLSAVTAYMDALRDEATLRLNENNVKVLTRQLEATQDRFSVGEVTRTDVAQAEAALSAAVSQRIQAEATLATSRATYRQVIGKMPGTLDDAPPLPPLPASEEGATEIALAENPIIRAARLNERAAQYDVTVAKGAILPTISGFVQRSKGNSPTQVFDPQLNEFVGGANRFKQTQYGVTLTVPLYQGGSEYAAVRQQKQVRSQRMQQIASAERQVLRDVNVAWENYRAAQANIEATRSQVRANEIALEGVRQESQVGARTVLDVLDAEQTLLDSRVNLVSAQRDEYVRGFEMLQAIGRLNAVALDLPVEIYDPEGYYKDVKWQLVGWGTGDY